MRCVNSTNQAMFLSENAVLKHCDRNTKYYEYRGNGYKVTQLSSGDFIINKLPLSEIEIITLCSSLNFNGF